MTQAGESDFIRHEPCPECGSRDNLARYSDGHGFCHGCRYWEPGDMDESDSGTIASDRGKLAADVGRIALQGDYASLPARKLKEETCRFWGYRVGEWNDKPAQLAYYFDPETRKPVGAKVRLADKSFSFTGDFKKAPLYGQWLWKAGGKMVVVCEGEIDAMSVSQLQQLKWPVVSVKNGAQGASKNLKENLEWLDSFETIVLMFDMDEVGQKAAKECAELFDGGKCKIASLPMKDANECLQAGKGEEVIKAMWNAQVYRPDGIVAGSSITRESLKQGQVKSYPTGLPLLDAMTGGLREGELTLLTAGSGIGKSTWARELAYHLLMTHGLTIGNVYLEESLDKTAKGYVAIHNNVPLGLLRRDPEILTDEQWDTTLRDVIHNGMYFYDHFGSLESDRLISKLKYLKRACGVRFVVLDHISIIISGNTSSSEGERRDIDILMTKLRSLVEATGLGIIAIVHLKQPEGRAHEEGGRVTLSHLRGSGALKQLSDNVYALERNQQGKKKDTSIVRVLKCREFGDTGQCDALLYNRETGRLKVDNGYVPETEFETEDTEF